MIAGVVNAAYEPVITLAVQGPAGRTRDIDAVIDTGFGGLLTLPPALVAELGLLFKGTGRATLADGSEVDFPSYGVDVLWDGSGYPSTQTPPTPPRSSACGCSTATACTWKSRTAAASSSKPQGDARRRPGRGRAEEGVHKSYSTAALRRAFWSSSRPSPGRSGIRITPPSGMMGSW